MRLYIAEKPSLARAIAAVLPKPQQKQQGYIQLANGDCVTWCVGHLLEQAEPEVYDARYKQWRLDDLPIIPQNWQWLAKPKTKSQLACIKKLSKGATALVHAGDPDREGQLLVDLVLEHCKLSAKLKSTVQRCLISDLNPPAVKQALAKLRPNNDFIPLSTSALARSRADWLYGINLTRSFTVRGRQQGYQSVLSVGRVQTPILGLVVRRDNEIAHFVPHNYYQVQAQLETDKGQTFQALWQPSEACAAHQDSEGRMINPKLAEHVAALTTGKPAKVQRLKQQQKRLNPPLPYNLSSLQIDAAKRFNMPAKQVLDICQKLYEQHQLITYPRSDSRYLPKAHHAQAAKVVAAIAKGEADLSAACGEAQLSLRSKAWNDAKVDAHHAIIPTAKAANVAQLGQGERNVYQLVARQYLAQFYPAYEYLQTEVELDIADGCFKASARQEQQQGWKVLFPKSKDKAQATLPPLREGEILDNRLSEVLVKQTQPPKAFNDATLLAAMTGISRYVQDPALKAVLKETDGLGTEATRAGIIELLFKRQYLQRQAKNIHATDNGKALVTALPDACTFPDMTAIWEQQLNAIAHKQQSYQGFMQAMQQQLSQLLAEPISAQAFSGLKSPLKAKQRAYRRKGPARRKKA